MKTLASLLSVMWCFLWFAIPAYASDIAVDEDCSLADSITAANTDEAVGGCPAGSGADVIILSADLTRITTEMAIQGGGFSISGRREFRIFFVEASGKLTIERVTLLNGKASEVELSTARTIEAGGAIFNQGVLHVKDCRFTGNSATDGGAILNGGELSISDSAFSGNSADNDGGAIYNYGELSVSDSVFSVNAADDDGGAIYNLDETKVSGSAFAENSADQDGGGIYNNGRLSMSGSLITDNSADAGGAIFNYYLGELSVVGTTFTDNSAYYRGGANYNEGAATFDDSAFSSNAASLGGAIHNEKDLRISNSAFSGNAAQIGGALNNLGELSVISSKFSGNVAGTGGAINNSVIDSPGELSVSNSIFTGNSATGGGAISNDGELAVFHSQFAYNSAQVVGGAIANFGTLEASNSSFYGNVAKRTDDSNVSDESFVPAGGALSVFGFEKHTSTVTLAHVTMTLNSAEGEGASIYVQSTDHARVNLRNSIIAGDTGLACSGPLAESISNLIEDGSCNAALNGDPMLGELVEPEDGSPAYIPLLAGSPAIDAADSDFCPESDQIGKPRPQGAGCDIGAIEFVPEQ